MPSLKAGRERLLGKVDILNPFYKSYHTFAHNFDCGWLGVTKTKSGGGWKLTSFRLQLKSEKKIE